MPKEPAFDSSFDIEAVDPRSPEAALLIRALSEELARRYDFTEDGSGNFRPEDVLGARAGFVIGRTAGKAVACGAFRPMEPGVAEIKRMFVMPEHRGRGYSKAVLAELERGAWEAGYATVRLETGDRQPEAIGLYRRAGYRRIPNFGIYKDIGSSLCFEKQIAPAMGLL